MQDRYAGDVGDFGKFSLLRALCEDPNNKLGVVWYSFPDESHNGDGRHTDYVRNPQYSICDNELIQCLSKVVVGERSISNLEKQNILPLNTVYFSKTLDFHKIYPTQTKAHKTARRNGRLQWLNDAVKTVSKCNIVFVDPDNGIEIPSIPNIHQIKSGKYTYLSELKALFSGKQACVVYHHLNMNESHEAQVHHRAKQLKRAIHGVQAVFALRFWPYSPRAFFICASEDYTEIAKTKITQYFNGSCRFGWDTYYEI